jgi:SNF2 family DNA or RNA helicase
LTHMYTADDERMQTASTTVTAPDPSNQLVPTRMEIMTRLLVEQRDPTHRILIFSEHDSSLGNIQSILGGQPYAMLSGHSTTRTRVLDAYKSGQIPILLLNSRMNGAGIDLPETTDVILFHTMHPSIEDQSIGRGHRLGRTTPLRVHRFTTSS